MTRPITLRQYYSAFKSLSGLFAGLTSLSPLLSMGLPERSSVYVFPPLGSADAPARVGAFALALAVTYLAFVWKSVRAGNNRNRITFFIGSSGFGVGMPNRLGSGFRQFWNSNLEDGYRLERCVF